MATGPVKRVAASALNKTAKIAKATASKHSPPQPAPASPTVAAKPTGVKASNPLSQSPPPAITTTPASSSSSSPLSPTTELTEGGSSRGAPSPPGGSGGGGAGRGQQQGKGQEEAPHQQSRPFPKWKAAVWTVAFTAVTVTGTIYGAGLKTQKEWNQLFKTKLEIEQKLADVRERMRLEKEKEEKVKSGAVATPRR
ncbi:hypothetical protein NEUTE2DRAFT_49980 [Neurospora tetrasperma FGSC 2509]|nr:hypothetical protein NEUTE2DRAFT_49980 [Neurospora tetrasperma FGSC 2509]